MPACMSAMKKLSASSGQMPLVPNAFDGRFSLRLRSPGFAEA